MTEKENDKNYLPTLYQQYIHLSRYSRYQYDLGRRETWPETVERYFDFFQEHLKEQCDYDLSEKDRTELRDAILNLEVMPSMRALMSAGPALTRDNLAGFNCSFLAIDNPRAFDELLYILMCGTGVGYSVERQFVNKLPVIADEFHDTDTVIVVPDSKIGWAKSFRELIHILYGGQVPKWDLSRLRPSGAVLKTFGGRSSGPEPLDELFRFTVNVFRNAAGRKLNSIECHDICCKVGTAIVVGGVRRSALISLSNLTDTRLRTAKSGNWWETEPQRALANNSVAYTEKPDIGIFMDEWKALYDSKSGERGIFNRVGAVNHAEKNGRRDLTDYSEGVGTNPCLTGDTMVYVADGRGSVSIKELAEIGDDVAVITTDDDGIIRARTMRRPRKTAENAPIYKITLDNGESIRCTGNHKFPIREQGEKEVKDLVEGDSLYIIKRGVRQFKKNTKSKYATVSYGRHWRAEHRPIAEYFYNIDLSSESREKLREDSLVVHHKDFDLMNNHPDNLQIMTKKDHDDYHRRDMMGKNNPVHKILADPIKRAQYVTKQSINKTGEGNGRYSGVSNEELKQHILTITMNKGRRISINDWQEYAAKNKIPLQFSGKWRTTHFGEGGMMGAFKDAALECGFDHIDVDPRTVAKLQKYLSKGYDCFIDETNRVKFNKICEVTGKKFTTYHPETSQLVRRKPTKESIAKQKISSNRTYDQRRNELRNEQANVYIKLKNLIGKSPMKTEWINACKDIGISYEISRKSSPFRSFNDLKEYAEIENHQIVSVEFDGYEDVYNGTVDDFHTFFIGGFNEDDKQVFVKTCNCGEILLRGSSNDGAAGGGGLCNLSEVIIRHNDTEESLKNKVKLATILGTFQSTLTNYRYINKKWQKNSEEERLLGVSLTGIMDCTLTNGKKKGLEQLLTNLKNVAIDTNKKWADKLGIEQSAAITTGKPSGTVSALCDTSSGIHSRFAPYYRRNVRADKTDPLAKMMIDGGFPYEDDVMNPHHMVVFSFPMKSPTHAIFQDDIDAITQLEHCVTVKNNWCEHNQSVTITVREEEWMRVGSWTYDHWDDVVGISYLPHVGSTYRQMPFEKITKEEYDQMVKKMPKDVDWGKLIEYENSDTTTGSQELNCSAAGGCEI